MRLRIARLPIRAEANKLIRLPNVLRSELYKRLASASNNAPWRPPGVSKQPKKPSMRGSSRKLPIAPRYFAGRKSS